MIPLFHGSERAIDALAQELFAGKTFCPRRHQASSEQTFAAGRAQTNLAVLSGIIFILCAAAAAGAVIIRRLRAAATRAELLSRTEERNFS